MDREKGVLVGIRNVSGALEPLPQVSRSWFHQQATPECDGDTSRNHIQTRDRKSPESSLSSSMHTNSDTHTSLSPDTTPLVATRPSAIYLDPLHFNWSVTQNRTDENEAWTLNMHEPPPFGAFRAQQASSPTVLDDPIALRMNDNDIAPTTMSSRPGSVPPPPPYNIHNGKQAFWLDREAEHVEQAEQFNSFQHNALVRIQQRLQDQQTQIARQRAAFLDQLRSLLTSLPGPTMDAKSTSSSLPDTSGSIPSASLAGLNYHVNSLQAQATNLGLLEVDFVQAADDFIQGAGPSSAVRDSFPPSEDIFAIPPSPVTSFMSIESEDLHPMAREYHNLVGSITIIRDRLNELEISHRNDIGMRTSHQKGERIQDLEDIETVELPERIFLDRYFTTRSEMVKDLLITWKQADRLRTLCEQDAVPLWEPEESNTLEEAIKYNFDGVIGQMYAMHHKGTHFGVRPLELLQIPFFHTEDRMEHWIAEVHQELLNTSRQERQLAIETIAPEHLFKLYYSKLATRRSPMFEPQEIHTPHTYGLEVYEERLQWPVWAGEYTRREDTSREYTIRENKPRSSSDPGNMQVPRDHFASWLDEEVHSCIVTNRE